MRRQEQESVLGSLRLGCVLVGVAVLPLWGVMTVVLVQASPWLRDAPDWLGLSIGAVVSGVAVGLVSLGVTGLVMLVVRTWHLVRTAGDVRSRSRYRGLVGEEPELPADAWADGAMIHIETAREE